MVRQDEDEPDCQGRSGMKEDSELDFAQILNTIGQGVLITGEGWRFEYVNPAFARIVGEPIKDLIGMSMDNFIIPRDLPLLYHHRSKRLAGETSTYEFALIRSDGQMVCVHATGAPRWLEDKVIGSISIITDLTERRLAEKALQDAHDNLERQVKERTEELAKKNEEMERFIYTVSHDLRAPLISMSGFLSFIEQDAQMGDLNRHKTDLGIVGDAITKMDKLLMDTLELSRIGRVISLPEDVPLGEIISDALGQTKEKIDSKGINVSIASDLPVVHVDKMRIVELLVNLIENSIKYMGSQIRPVIMVGQRAEGNQRILFVRDNGMGIDPSQHDKVFGLFYKIDPKSEGTGAGLAIVKRIIEVHGGRIWIESELGKGCTVCFTLPLTNIG